MDSQSVREVLEHPATQLVLVVVAIVVVINIIKFLKEN